MENGPKRAETITDQVWKTASLSCVLPGKRNRGDHLQMELAQENEYNEMLKELVLEQFA